MDWMAITYRDEVVYEEHAISEPNHGGDGEEEGESDGQELYTFGSYY